MIVCPVCRHGPRFGKLSSFLSDFHASRRSLDCACGRLRFKTDREASFYAPGHALSVFFGSPMAGQSEREVMDAVLLAVASSVLEC